MRRVRQRERPELFARRVHRDTDFFQQSPHVHTAGDEEIKHRDGDQTQRNGRQEIRRPVALEQFLRHVHPRHPDLTLLRRALGRGLALKHPPQSRLESPLLRHLVDLSLSLDARLFRARLRRRRRRRARPSRPPPPRPIRERRARPSRLRREHRNRRFGRVLTSRKRAREHARASSSSSRLSRARARPRRGRDGRRRPRGRRRASVSRTAGRDRHRRRRRRRHRLPPVAAYSSSSSSSSPVSSSTRGRGDPFTLTVHDSSVRVCPPHTQ